MNSRQPEFEAEAAPGSAPNSVVFCRAARAVQVPFGSKHSI
jgi:hypothetical protein